MLGILHRVLDFLFVHGNLRLCVNCEMNGLAIGHVGFC